MPGIVLAKSVINNFDETVPIFLSIICQIYYKRVAGFDVMRHKKSVYFIKFSFLSEKNEH